MRIRFSAFLILHVSQCPTWWGIALAEMAARRSAPIVICGRNSLGMSVMPVHKITSLMKGGFSTCRLPSGPNMHLPVE